MKIFRGYTSDKTTVAAGATARVTWTNTYDGPVKLKEVFVAGDATIQSDGKVTIRVAGHVAAQAISFLSTTYSCGFQDMDTDIQKGESVEFEVYNGHSSTTAYFQGLVNAYEER